MKLLTIRPEALDLLMELSIQIDKELGNEEIDVEAEKQTAIALCRRRIDAAINLYRDGVITRDDYLADIERNEREIIHWETRNSETKQRAAELALCMEALNNLSRMWDISDDSERQALAKGLFTELTFNLNARRIVNFRLKPWADRFITLRASLYDTQAANENDDNGDNDGDGETNIEVINLNEKLGKMWQDVGRSPVWGKGCLFA